MNSNPRQDPVERLLLLLGEPVLLLHWPFGSKGVQEKWGHLRADVEMKDPQYLAQLRKGNIGVALGEKSGALISIDWDDDESLSEFLRINHEIANTLQSKGSRGGNLWYRMDGPYPKLTYLKRGSLDVGEWRSTGGQTIIHGVHPSGVPYRLVNEVRVMQIRFDQIHWPEGIRPPTNTDCSRSRVDGATHAEVEKGATTSVYPLNPRLSSLSSSVNTIEDCVGLTLPATCNRNHRALFEFGRALKTLEAKREKKLSPNELKGAFDQWYHAASDRKILRETQPRDIYFSEFLDGLERVERLLGDDQTLQKAFEAAKVAPPHPSSEFFTDPTSKLLVNLCYQLHLAAPAGGKPWFLSCYSAGILLGISHTQANRLLRSFVSLRILTVVEKGFQGRASRYQFRMVS